MLSCTTEISGTVIRANERGLMLSGRDGWLNVSKYADGLALPPAGVQVTIGLDKAGFIRAIHADGPAQAAPDAPTATSAPPASRETAITRMACLNTATAIGATWQRPLAASEVMALAGELEGWVTR